MTTTTVECDDSGRFGGRSVAVVVAIAVVVVRRPPRGRSSRRRGALSEEEDDDGDERGQHGPRWRWGAPTQQPTIDVSVVGGWAAACKKSSGRRKGEGRCRVVASAWQHGVAACGGARLQHQLTQNDTCFFRVFLLDFYSAC